MNLSGIKDKLYYYLAEKNWGVCREYGPYVDAHQEEHAKKPWKHWWMLMRLNWHYRILRKTTLLYLEPSMFRDGSQQRLPYLDGAESEVAKRPLPVHLAMRMLPYDVVSFDIFDTLLLRPFAQPKDIFHIIGQRLNVPEFYQLRVDAEQSARKINKVKNGTSETTLEDIYTIIESKTGLDKNVGMETEFLVEKHYCKANPYMQQVFKQIRDQNKTIVLVSDMYLPINMLENILAVNGYTGYKKLYLSCDYGCSKQSKGLFKFLLKDFKNKTIIHIGDNEKSDIYSAKSLGIDASFYKRVTAVGQQYRPTDMSELIGSAYSGIVNAHLHNGVRKYDPYYEFGFVYGGLYIFGFCNWIHKLAHKRGIQKVLFLARDGAIYQNVFQRYFGDIPSEYFLWSRLAKAKYTFEHGRFSAFEKDIRAYLSYNNTFSVGDMLHSFGLSALESSLPQYGLKKCSLILEETMPKIEKLFCVEWQKIVEIYKPQKQHILEYIRDKIGDAKKIAIVDVGWAGSGPLSVKNIIQNDMHLNCEVSCLLAAATSSSKVKIAANILDGSIDAYIFDSSNNRGNYDRFLKSNKGLNGIFFEIFTQACAPTFCGMDELGNYLFGLAEVENYGAIEKIHKGIMDFCEIYYRTFADDPFMYNISGCDAFAPFKLAMSDICYFENVLGDFTISRVIGDRDEGRKTITVREFIHESLK